MSWTLFLQVLVLMFSAYVLTFAIVDKIKK